MTNDELEKQRSYIVAKSNDFIQKSRFKLTLPEQKVIWYIISKVKYEDEEFKPFKFSISEYCRICNFEASSGGNYDMIRDAIKTLADKSMWIKTNPKTVSLMRWINEVDITEGSGEIEVKLSDKMSPYLLQLRENYTSLDLSVALAMKRKYSIRLYEILRCYVGLKEKKIKFKLDDFKEKMDINLDKKFSELKKDIINPAIEEIDEYSDFYTTYALEKTGRKYTDIEFRFKNKTAWQYHQSINAVDKRLSNISTKEDQISFVQ